MGGGTAGAGGALAAFAAPSATRVPHFVQNPWLSASGLPQFRQNPAIWSPLSRSRRSVNGDLRSIVTENARCNQPIRVRRLGTFAVAR